MKLGKIISLLLVAYFLLKVTEKVMYEIHHPSRTHVIDLSYGLFTYITIPLVALWFYKNNGIKKGTK